MFAAVEEALRRLYPTRRWAERDEEAAFGAGVGAGEGARIARALAARLDAQAILRPGTPHETCDYIYVLCVGRPPSLLELREGLPSAEMGEADAAEIHELYLRVALSSVARFAAVQEVAMRAARGPRLARDAHDAHNADNADNANNANNDRPLVITEAPRTGVFDPILLRRFQALVAVLAEHGVRHLDFGEIIEPPPGFDPGDYADRYGGTPAVANYLFYPQPPNAVTTTLISST